MNAASLDANEFFVEKIIAKKMENGEAKYLIKWEGYGDEFNTWEPLVNLTNIQGMIQEFDEENKKRPSKCVKSKEMKESKELKESKEQKNVKNGHVRPKYKTNQQIEEEKLGFDVMENIDINIPDEIISLTREGEQIMCLVKFKERADGIRMQNCFVPATSLRDLYPKILIKFYESKIKFIDYLSLSFNR
jgi:hypothetical protein